MLAETPRIWTRIYRRDILLYLHHVQLIRSCVQLTVRAGRRDSSIGFRYIEKSRCFVIQVFPIYVHCFPHFIDDLTIFLVILCDLSIQLVTLHLLELTRCWNFEMLLRLWLRASFLNRCSPVHGALLKHLYDQLLVLTNVTLAGLRAAELILAILSSMLTSRCSMQHSFRHYKFIIITIRTTAFILHPWHTASTLLLLICTKS